MPIEDLSDEEREVLRRVAKANPDLLLQILSDESLGGIVDILERRKRIIWFWNAAIKVSSTIITIAGAMVIAWDYIVEFLNAIITAMRGGGGQ